MKKKSVLIIGSTPAGITSALGFADLGFHVHLVEPAPFLEKGGGDGVASLDLHTRQLTLTRHPNITLWTNTKISRLRGDPGDLKVGLKQHPRYVDTLRCTACGECIQVCPVTVPGTEHKVIYQEGQPGCLVIDKLGVSPCANTCPGGIHVQGYIALIAQERFQEAIDLIRQAIPFPGICGRVCTHPCEINCRRNEIDQPVAVRLLKRFVADWELSQPGLTGKIPQPAPVEFETEKSNKARIAVVGAGPGGMAVANSLAQRGYRVTVFEKLPEIGGMMAVGIPRYRLPRDVIDREYQHIIDLGVDVKTNTPIGPDGRHTLDDLFNMGYRAVCLAVGAHQSQSLGIPGEDLDGVHHGIDLLKRINIDQDMGSFLPRGPKTRLGIIGGGNTAMDVARSLKRLGVEEVRVLYRRTRSEMPAMPEEVEDAMQEGVGIEFLVSPQHILGDNENGVSGMECIRMQLGEPDASGRRRPIPIAGSEYLLELDLVILAIGQNPGLDFLTTDHDIAITRDQRINVSEGSFMTDRPGVFAVGDAVTRDKMAVIEAIGMGKRAAEGIITYLHDEAPKHILFDAREVPVAHRTLSPTDLMPRPRIPIPTLPIAQRQTSFDEVEIGFSHEQAVNEARRCLACGPCSECQACVQVCQAEAILHDQVEKTTEIEAGAMVYAIDQTNKDNSIRAFLDPDTEKMVTREDKGVFHINGSDSLSSLAVITQAIPFLFDPFGTGLFKTESVSNGRQASAVTWPKVKAAQGNPIDRMGVFICHCGLENEGEISSVIDLGALGAIVAHRLGDIHVQTLPFSCSPEGAKAIEIAIQNKNLDGVVIAGCTCCSIDQVCYSCTYQRVRCKENLNIFDDLEQAYAGNTNLSETTFEFVNIREQCAWVHKDDPDTATKKAAVMITAAVNSLMSSAPRQNPVSPKTRSAIILGNSQNIQDYASSLERFSIEVQIPNTPPNQIVRDNGHFTITSDGQTWQAPSLVLVPEDEGEASKFNGLFEHWVLQPHIISHKYSIDPINNGVFFITPGMDTLNTASAVAARAAIWLNQKDKKSQPVSYVDPSRCRACGTCVEVCEFGAPEILPYNDVRASWIDTAICTGCGVCAAHCPSNAITTRFSTDLQIDSMLNALLSHPG